MCPLPPQPHHSVVTEMQPYLQENTGVLKAQCEALLNNKEQILCPVLSFEAAGL